MAKRNTETTNDTNRDDAPHAASEENSAQALIQRAFLALGVLDAELRTDTAKFERKNDKPIEAFFSIMYAAIVAIDESGGTEAFLASRGIRANGNVKNPYFLIVRAFADSTCAFLQGRLCKKAQVIQLARLQDVKPNEFEKWKKLWPIERACVELRRRSNSPRQQKKDSSAPKLATRGLTGEHLVLVAFSPDASGRHRLIRIPSSEDLLKYAEPIQEGDADNAAKE
jgi:hypothetical protein